MLSHRFAAFPSTNCRVIATAWSTPTQPSGAPWRWPEFRFPMIDYFAMRFPLPIVISRVGGAIFTDIGSAWFGDNFKGGTSSGGQDRLQDIKMGFGFGMRMNLGFFLLRYDLAWSTDLNRISDKPSYYFSFGADF